VKLPPSPAMMTHTFNNILSPFLLSRVEDKKTSKQMHDAIMNAFKKGLARGSMKPFPNPADVFATFSTQKPPMTTQWDEHASRTRKTSTDEDDRSAKRPPSAPADMPASTSPARTNSI
jgi:hypothetical protein